MRYKGTKAKSDYSKAISQLTLSNIYNIAAKLHSARKYAENPYVLFHSTLSIYCHNQKLNVDFDKVKQSILETPLKRHQNIINAFVEAWLDVDNQGHHRSPGEGAAILRSFGEQMTSEQKQTLAVLQGLLERVNRLIPEGYRTPMVLLDYAYYLVYEDKEQTQLVLNDAEQQAMAKIVSDQNELDCILTAYWMKQVAAWQN